MPQRPPVTAAPQTSEVEFDALRSAPAIRRLGEHRTGMPLFYFDVEGATPIKDETGTELSGPDEARDHAMRLLRSILRAEIPDGDELSLRIAVRDQDRSPVYVVALAIGGIWLAPRSAR